jgi:hypothetical protein
MHTHRNDVPTFEKSDVVTICTSPSLYALMRWRCFCSSVLSFMQPSLEPAGHQHGNKPESLPVDEPIVRFLPGLALHCTDRQPELKFPALLQCEFCSIQGLSVSLVGEALFDEVLPKAISSR